MLAFRLKTGTAGKLNVAVSLSREKSVEANTASVASDVGIVSLRANSGQTNGIAFTSVARVVQTGGKLIVNFTVPMLVN